MAIDDPKKLAEAQDIANEAIKEGTDLTRVLGTLLDKQIEKSGKYNVIIKNRAKLLNDDLNASKKTLPLLQQAVQNQKSISVTQNKIAQARNKEGKFQQGFNHHIEKGLKTDLAALNVKKESIKLEDLRKEALDALVSKAKSLAKALTIGSVIAGLVGIATKFGAVLDTIGQKFGSLSVMGKEFQTDLLDASVEATKLGGGIEDVASITSTLASNFGMNVDEAAKLSSKVFDTSKALGLSGDQAATLFGTLMQTANLSDTQAEKLAEGAFQLARQAGVAPQAVMADIANSTEDIAEFTKDGGDNIAEAAVQARQMGLSLSTTAKISKGLLDFQSSISNEIEASVLIGKQLNFQRARQLALEGDIAGATKEVVSQLGSEAEFNKLNVLQRESLAKSIGVSVSELSKMVGQTDKLTLSGAMAGKSFGDMLGQDALSNISNMMNEIKALGAMLIKELGPAIDQVIGSFKTFLQEGGGLATIQGIIVGVGKALQFVANNLPTVIGLMVAFKAATMASAAAAGIQAIFGATAATAYGFGFGGAIVAGLLATLAASFMTSVPKFQGGGNSVKPFIAGEGGVPELVVTGNNASKVFNGEQTRQMLNNGGDTKSLEKKFDGLIGVIQEGNELTRNQRIIAERGILSIATEPQRAGAPLN